MKSRAGYALFASAGLMLLAGAASFQLSRDWRVPVRQSVVLLGPDLDGEKRLEAKDSIARQVLLGAKPLLEAAAAFRRLDDGAPPRFVRAPQLFPDASSEDEAYCRAVIVYVKATVAPKWGTLVTEGLQDELDAKLRNGTLHLNQAGAAPSGVPD
jgi:hypothetical protein